MAHPGIPLDDTAGSVRWEAELDGDAEILELLARSFREPPIEIRGGSPDRYILSSRSFDGVESHETVKELADEIVRQLNGASALYIGRSGNVKTGGLRKLNPDGSRAGVFAFLDTGVLTLRGNAIGMEVHRADGSVERIEPLDQTVRWMRAAQANPAAAKVLRLVAVDSPSWDDLYRLLEVVEAAAGPDTVNGWIGARERNRFRHTANSVEAAGDAARHGHESRQPPKDPMSLTAARQLIRDVAKRFLDMLVP